MNDSVNTLEECQAKTYLCKMVDRLDHPAYKAQKMALLTMQQVVDENTWYVWLDSCEDNGINCRLRWWIIREATFKDRIKYELFGGRDV